MPGRENLFDKYQRRTFHELKYNRNVSIKLLRLHVELFHYKSYNQMTKHKRTPWMLDNVSIDRYGGVDFSFTPASPCNASDARDSHEFFDIMSSASFDIILETRSDSFAKSRYKIKRFRFTSPNSHEEETIFEVTERTGNYLRHLLFHFPNTGKAYCDVAEYRR